MKDSEQHISYQYERLNLYHVFMFRNPGNKFEKCESLSGILAVHFDKNIKKLSQMVTIKYRK